ncbi:hypothetical protein G7043_13390 [Lentzea sp. NEAU-D13]|uniref:Ig-like domain-containing protein n=1 Tax=Lentzea alba TaxID=2714351 RepID=A0A7C9VV90_9PSEU|nr:hypothetical protein [Lentzea alba]NGY59918.1 hypothetical protein [Lentzea alba]
MKSRNLVLAVVGAGLSLAGLAAPAASATTSGDVSVQDVHRKSASCTSPSGKKINISWGDGSTSTTVYYNNHCNQARAIELYFRPAGEFPFTRCFVAPARDQGSKQIGDAKPVEVTILAGGRC